MQINKYIYIYIYIHRPVLCGMFHLYFDLGFWHALLHFPLFPWIPQCVFCNFACFCIVFPGWMVLREVCAILGWWYPLPLARKYAPVLCGKFHLCFDLGLWLALLHFPLFFLGSSSVFSTVLHVSAGCAFICAWFSQVKWSWERCVPSCSPVTKRKRKEKWKEKERNS